MLDIKILENSPHFKKRTLEVWEYLFYEGEIDENIYIILVWELKVEKYTNSEKKDKKILATLKKNEVFWEASLNTNKEKQTSIRAKRKTTLLYINANKWLENFRKDYPTEAFNLLKYIIHLSSKRLNISNNLITASYTISQEIIELKDFSYKTIFELIEKIKLITKTDEEIIYLEENPILKEYVTLKYRTGKKWRMENQVIKIYENKLDLLDLKTKWKYNYTQNLKIWDKNYWYLVFIRNDLDFSENEIKILSILSTSLAWVLKQKEYLREQKNKDYIKNL